MITLESFLNEVNAEFYDIEMDLCLIQGTHVYTEAANEAKKNIFQRVIEMIKQLIQKIKDKVQEVIQNHKLKKVQEAIEKNPELANKKVKVPDYDKLHKLNAETLNRLSDEKCDPEKEIDKYKKQRNILLGSAAALTTVTIGLAISTSKLAKKADESQELLSNAETLADNLQQKYFKLLKDYSDINDKHKDELEKQRKTYTDELEKQKNAYRDELRKEINSRSNDNLIDSKIDYVQKSLQAYDKTQKYHIHKINRDIDMAIKRVKSIQSISQSESNDLIRYLTNIFNRTQNIPTSGRDKKMKDINSMADYLNRIV